MDEKWIKWARDQRAQYKQWLANAESGRFKTQEMDGSGNLKDNTPEYIASLKATITSLDELIGETFGK